MNWQCLESQVVEPAGILGQGIQNMIGGKLVSDMLGGMMMYDDPL